VIRRIGIDTCEIERMATAVRRSGEKFLAKVFTPDELAYCAGRMERLAGRWAAKEAVIKCFDGTPICFPRRQIEVLPALSGAPRVRLLGDDRGARIQVTITHQGGIAVAGAVLEMPSSEDLLEPFPPSLRLPDRPVDGHKGTFGQVVVIAGSRGYTGAAYMSSTAAARVGAGTVRLLVADSIYPILAVKCTEVMATPVAEGITGALGLESTSEIHEHLETATAGVLGPGLGSDQATWAMIHDLVDTVTLPLVLDADALNALSAKRELLEHLGQDGRVRILTPHPGEMSRLLDVPTRELQRDREKTAADAARRWRAVVVLKGAHTVTAAPDGRVEVDPHAVPALATGGTGDVLAGVVAGLLAQGSEPFQAAVTGVYVHAAAGRRIEAAQGSAGLLATDLLPVLPRVMRDLRDLREAAR
jgi:hydroxyethylthiazole kinase-like uncharacterized protein yjeF